jgi:tetratricopeptide (TPR) repeat protein
VVHMERAVACDPLNGFWRGVLASHLTHAELYDRAIEQAHEALKIDALNFVPYFTLGEAYATLRRWPEAIEVLERARGISPHDGMTTGLLAGALARVGETTRAAGLARELGEAPRPLIGRVLYHVLCLETDLAAEWYERAIKERDPFALVFANTPLLKAFRQTNRWPKLAGLMRMPDA